MTFLRLTEIMDARASRKPLTVLTSEMDGSKVSFLKRKSTGSLEDSRAILMQAVREDRVIGYDETHSTVVITLERNTKHDKKDK